MENFTLNWTDLWWGILMVAIVYLIMLIIRFLLRHTFFIGKTGVRPPEKLESFSIIIEPLLLVALLAIFILINPILHGLFILFVSIPSFQLIKNYMNGRIFQFNNQLEKGQHIKVSEESGIVQKLGRLGLTLRTGEGFKFIHYGHLLEEGFTLLKGATVGGFHQIGIRFPEDGKETNHQMKTSPLEAKLLDCPYLDWTFKPEIQFAEKHTYLLKILLIKDQHLEYFLEWLHSNEYTTDTVS